MKLVTAMKKAIDAFSKEKPDAMIRLVSFEEGTGQDAKALKATFRIQYTKKDDGYVESDTHPFYVTVFDLGCGSCECSVRVL